MTKHRKILLVCLGNICRSPVAEGVLRAKAEARGLPVEVESAGTGAWHVGKGADSRMVSAAAGRGYDLRAHRARQADMGDFYIFDHIFAMDESNLADLKDLQPADGSASLEMFLARTGRGEVPDPYYGGADGFQHVIDLVEEASDVILNDLFPERGHA